MIRQIYNRLLLILLVHIPSAAVIGFLLLFSFASKFDEYRTELLPWAEKSILLALSLSALSWAIAHNRAPEVMKTFRRVSESFIFSATTLIMVVILNYGITWVGDTHFTTNILKTLSHVYMFGSAVAMGLGLYQLNYTLWRYPVKNEDESA